MPEPTPAPSWAALRAQLGSIYFDVAWLAKDGEPITREQLERLEELVRKIRGMEGC